jgi:ubiquinone/menaquinone biosynthesis C-methylase UbiE
MLSGLRGATASMIPDQLRIIDIACGTGALAFELSKNAAHVTAIDVSESMIATANQLKEKRGMQHVTFQVADATDLSSFSTNEFDVATISLAIHQFDTPTGLKILEELKRIARRILIVDYTSPLPANNYKSLTWFIEWMAGGDHFRNFKTYHEFGGIDTYLKQLQLQVIKKTYKGKSIFSLVLCK